MSQIKLNKLFPVLFSFYSLYANSTISYFIDYSICLKEWWNNTYDSVQPLNTKKWCFQLRLLSTRWVNSVMCCTTIMKMRKRYCVTLSRSIRYCVVYSTCVYIVHYNTFTFRRNATEIIIRYLLWTNSHVGKRFLNLNNQRKFQLSSFSS